MKYINVILFVFLFGCGQNYSIVTGDKGDSCVTTHDAINIYVTCGDTISSIARPQNGADGSQGAQGLAGTNGSNGTNGHNMLVTTLSTSSCSNGGTTLLMGLDVNNDNVLQGSEVTASAQVCNGLNGHNGTNGSNGHDGADGHDAPPTPFTPVALLNPCGDAPGVYDEVFLKLQNGTILASFSDNANGDNTRFAVVTPGTYQTTDGDHCVFTINASGTFTYENHHY